MEQYLKKEDKYTWIIILNEALEWSEFQIGK